jgi:hypothetical protein
MAPPGGGSSGVLSASDTLDFGFARFDFAALAYAALAFAAVAFALVVILDRFTFEVLAMGHSPS